MTFAAETAPSRSGRSGRCDGLALARAPRPRLSGGLRPSPLAQLFPIEIDGVLDPAATASWRSPGRGGRVTGGRKSARHAADPR